MNIIDHMGLTVSRYDEALSFYQEALAPLGISIVMQVKAEESGGYQGAGFGRDGKPSFWVPRRREDRAAHPRRLRRRKPRRRPRLLPGNLGGGRNR